MDSLIGITFTMLLLPILFVLLGIIDELFGTSILEDLTKDLKTTTKGQVHSSTSTTTNHNIGEH